MGAVCVEVWQFWPVVADAEWGMRVQAEYQVSRLYVRPHRLRHRLTQTSQAA
jgi:hypothetical protein